jgi:murein hydrolase activator
MYRFAALLVAVVLAGPAGADPAVATRAAALELLGAIDGLAQAESAADQIAALTRSIAAHEAGLQALGEGLVELGQIEAIAAGQFDARSAEVSRLLGALMAVSRVQGPALLAHPAGPLDTARAGMLMADLAPAMQAQADIIAVRLVELRDLRQLREAAQDTLGAGLASLRAAQDALGQATAARREPPPAIGQDEARLLALLESADTLEMLSVGLGILLPPRDSVDVVVDGFAQTRGQLPLPVRGSLHQPSGPDGLAVTGRPGLVLVTADGALVTAPVAGRLRYRGELSDYGNVILLEAGDDYLLLMAGLETVYPETGTEVLAGAPLGLMPTGAATDDNLAAPLARTRALYLELRQGGQPIDPGDWFDLTEAAP